MTIRFTVEETVKAFDQKLLESGYIPTEDGSLVQASESEKEELVFHDFIWYDFKLVQDILKNNTQESVFVCTYHAGERTYVSEGWHMVDRDGYLLTSERIIESGEVIDFGDGQD